MKELMRKKGFSKNEDPVRKGHPFSRRRSRRVRVWLANGEKGDRRVGQGQVLGR